MKLSPPQERISRSEARFKTAVCGRRFGKSFLSINEMAKFARVPNRKIVYVAPTHAQAKQIIFDELVDRLRNVRWIEKVNISEMNIYLKNKSVIMIRSGDKPDRLRGLAIDFLVLDEFADINPNIWESVRPALSDRQGHCLFIGTPKGFNWARDLFENGLNEDMPDWESFSFTTLDGGRVPAEEITAAKRDLDARSFRQEYLATFETFSGSIYYAFDRDMHTKSTEQPTDKDVIHIGLDFNVSPMSAICFVVRKDGLHAFDEIVIYGSNTYEMCDEIKQRFPKNRITVYPDASGGNQNTKGISDHKILQNAGFDLKAPRANPPVKDRISAMNSALKSMDGTIRFRINKKCRKLIDALTKQTYKDDTRQPDKSLGVDHFNDAAGYCVHYLMPVKRDIVPNKTKYWGTY